MSLKGKVAIVTVGARGIGAEIVRTLAAQGASVAFNYVSPSPKTIATNLATEIFSQGGAAVPIHCNMSSPGAPQTIIETTLLAFNTNTIDILINNAGLGQNTPLEEITLDEYDRLTAVNIRAVIFLTQVVLKHVPRGSRIVNLSSISARRIRDTIGLRGYQGRCGGFDEGMGHGVGS